jgi:hypothetical protein
MDYESIMSKQKEVIKEIVSKIKEYQKIISTGTNTIKMEQDLEREINNAKEMSSKLETAYNYKNAPSSIPPLELDRRQKQIQDLRDAILENEQNYRNYKTQKYAYKDTSDGNYEITDDMKNMNNNELLSLQKEKINQQDKMIDDIAMDVKKGKVLAREAGVIIKDQNAQLDDLQEEMDKLDSNFQKGIKRFQNYAKKQNGCCITIILILEFVATFLILFLL